MVLKLYSYFRSTNGLRVALILREKQVPFEFVPVDVVKGEHKDPAYKQNHPFGQVPYIDDDGFVLYESRAISRYIAEKYADQGTPLVPKTLQGRALYEQACSIESFNFDSLSSSVGFAGLRGSPNDELITKLDAKLDVYNTILAKQQYLAGDDITLADLFHLPNAALLVRSGSDLMTSKPHVARWFNDLKSRPSWKAVAEGITTATGF